MLTLGLFFSNHAVMSAEKKILIVTYADQSPYSEVTTGFKAQQKNATFIETAANSATIATAINVNKPDLIFAVGADATELAAKNTKSIPIVATLLLKSSLFDIANLSSG